MKKSKLLFSLGVLAFVAPLSACGTKTIENPDKRITSGTEPIVYIDEDNQFIKVNDPDAPENKKITSLEVTNPSITLFYNSYDKEYESKDVEYKILPYQENKVGLKFASSNPAVATVDENGKITAAGAGICEVTVSTLDGKLSSKTRVSVYDTDVAGTKLKSRKNSILSYQSSPTYVEPENVHVKQSVVSETVVNRSEVTASTKEAVDIWVSKKNNYFRYCALSQEVKCQGGSVEEEENEYIFYTKDFFTYVISKHGDTRNWMRIDQSKLQQQGLTEFDALVSVINNFFTSGSRIILQQFEYIKGSDYLGNADGFMDKMIRGGLNSEDAGSLAIESTFTKKYVVGAGQEDYLGGFPAGTSFSAVTLARCSWANYVSSGRYVDETYIFDTPEKYCEISNIEDSSFESEGVELYKPDLTQCKKVDSIFDL